MAANGTVLELEGPQSDTCVFCGPPGGRSSSVSAYSIGVTALSLTCQHYQEMLDRGWTRSGRYCYKRDMRRTCCPQYQDRLDVLKFTPTKKQRKVLYRWNRFVLDGDGDTEDKDAEPTATTLKGELPRKTSPFSLIDAIHSSEFAFTGQDSVPRHKFEVTLEPASFTDEKSELYLQYLRNVHKSEQNDLRPAVFKRFLADSPLQTAPIVYVKDPPDHLPKEYGSYHQIYRLDGELIAMGVLDILPSCVSSMYFVYNYKWEKFSLGKVSALREVALAKEMHDYGANGIKYLYMGYYVHSCQKMRYKGEYSPSFLLDPEEYTWYPLKDCISLLDTYRYACFSHPEHSIKDPDIPSETELKEISDDDASQILLRHPDAGIIPIPQTQALQHPYWREIFLRTIEGLGVELAKKVVLAI